MRPSKIHFPRIPRTHLGSTERILIGIGVAGVLTASAAVWWPSESPATAPLAVSIEEREPIVVESSVVSAPEAAQPQPMTTPETTVVAERPIVALAHEETSTDFEARAEEQIERGDLAGALESLRKHLFTHAPTPALLLQLARTAVQIEDHAIAEQALRDAGALDPTNPQVALELGRVLLEVGQLSEAREAARQAIRLDKESPLAWNLAGRVAMAESEWNRAEIALRQAVQLDPTDAMLHNNLGLLYVYMRRGTDAVDSLKTAVELYGDDVPPFVFNNLGLAHEVTGSLADAQDAFEQALVAQPDYARARVNLRRVLTTAANREQLEAMKGRTAELSDEATRAVEVGGEGDTTDEQTDFASEMVESGDAADADAEADAEAE
ncbi:MAG: tetratricopeptide repeat protein [Deltaproteobacteria bacterium]|nr:tetratricopeptide repeat protein [Deltaproteobacteria bacterium]